MASIIEIWSLPTCYPKYMTRNLMGFLELFLILVGSNAHPLLWAKCFGDHMRFFNLWKCGSVRDCMQFIIHPSLMLIILVWLAGRSWQTRRPLNENVWSQQLWRGSTWEEEAQVVGGIASNIEIFDTQILAPWSQYPTYSSPDGSWAYCFGLPRHCIHFFQW